MAMAFMALLAVVEAYLEPIPCALRWLAILGQGRFEAENLTVSGEGAIESATSRICPHAKAFQDLLLDCGNLMAISP